MTKQNEVDENDPVVKGIDMGRTILDAALNTAKNQEELNINLEKARACGIEILASMAFNYAMQQGETEGVFDEEAHGKFVVSVVDLIHKTTDFYKESFKTGDVVHTDIVSSMEPVNGVRIFNVGDSDWAYGENEEQAYLVMANMCGKDYVNEITEFNPILPIAQQQFDDGKIYYDKSGNTEGMDSPLISYRECLEDLTSDGSKKGHFMTTES